MRINDTIRLDFIIKHDVSFGKNLFFWTDPFGLRDLVEHDGNHRAALDKLIKASK